MVWITGRREVPPSTIETDCRPRSKRAHARAQCIASCRREQRKIPPIVRAPLAAHGADAEMVNKVKDWDRKDFDSMYVVTIGETEATFDQKHEGLDGQPDACPH